MKIVRMYSSLIFLIISLISLIILTILAGYMTININGEFGFFTILFACFTIIMSLAVVDEYKYRKAIKSIKNKYIK